MKNSHYKNFSIGKSFSDYDGALRYLKGKDQEIIKEDDPEFFSPPEECDALKYLSSPERLNPRALNGVGTRQCSE